MFSDFIEMYPSYQIDDILDDYARRFFSLLNEGYRRRYKHYQMLANISLLPQMNDKARNDMLRQLDWATKSPSDILKPSTNPTSEQAVERLLRG